MSAMALQHKELHDKIVELLERREHLDWQVISVLQKIDRLKAYRALGAATLHDYCTKFLKLSGPVAYNFIAVARSAERLPKLRDAIRSQKVSVYKAGRMAAVIDSENAEDLI